MKLSDKCEEYTDDAVPMMIILSVKHKLHARCCIDFLTRKFFTLSEKNYTKYVSYNIGIPSKQEKEETNWNEVNKINNAHT